jgi:hypothetical protein
MAACTRASVAALTRSGVLTARDTVAIEMPACVATSLMLLPTVPPEFVNVYIVGRQRDFFMTTDAALQSLPQCSIAIVARGKVTKLAYASYQTG